MKNNQVFLAIVLLMISILHSHAVINSLREYYEVITKYNFSQNKGKASTLIVGGKEAPYGKYKYIAGLREKRTSASFCGGAVIAPKFILTAAHCTEDDDLFYASIGTHYKRGDADGEQIEIKNITRHPQYDPENLNYDFAILELKRKTQMKPIALSKRDSDAPVGAIANAHGWGATEEDGAASHVLLDVQVPIISSEECAKNISDTILETMLCAGGGDLGKDTCQGDSGGPLVIKKRYSDEPVLVGVVSWGIGCSKANLPGVYGRVSKARNFVDSVVYGHEWR